MWTQMLVQFLFCYYPGVWFTKVLKSNVSEDIYSSKKTKSFRCFFMYHEVLAENLKNMSKCM